MSESTRRTFLQASGLTALAATRAWGANDRINLAIVGVGGRGRDHIKELRKAERRPYLRACAMWTRRTSNEA